MWLWTQSLMRKVITTTTTTVGPGQQLRKDGVLLIREAQSRKLMWAVPRLLGGGSWLHWQGHPPERTTGGCSPWLQCFWSPWQHGAWAAGYVSLEPLAGNSPHFLTLTPCSPGNHLTPSDISAANRCGDDYCYLHPGSNFSRWINRAASNDDLHSSVAWQRDRMCWSSGPEDMETTACTVTWRAGIVGPARAPVAQLPESAWQGLDTDLNPSLVSGAEVARAWGPSPPSPTAGLMHHVGLCSLSAGFHGAYLDNKAKELDASGQSLCLHPSINMLTVTRSVLFPLFQNFWPRGHAHTHGEPME